MLCYFYIIFIFILLHCPLSGPDLIYISLLIIPCIIYYVTNKETLTLGCLSYTFHLQEEKNSSIGFRKGVNGGRYKFINCPLMLKHSLTWAARHLLRFNFSIWLVAGYLHILSSQFFHTWWVALKRYSVYLFYSHPVMMEDKVNCGNTHTVDSLEVCISRSWISLSRITLSWRTMPTITANIAVLLPACSSLAILQKVDVQLQQISMQYYTNSDELYKCLLSTLLWWTHKIGSNWVAL